MPDPTEIAATLLAHRGGEQYRSPRFNPRLDERFADRNERREAACIVGDAGTLESRTVARHGNIQFRTKHSVQVGRQDDARVVQGRSTLRPYKTPIEVPSPHVPYVVHV